MVAGAGENGNACERVVVERAKRGGQGARDRGRCERSSCVHLFARAEQES
jgi:hypothetical protein